ncbi:MAG: response regulator [Desulfobulbaceae bacterium]|nr:response regulator [Desulfobulbaceae bacterium]
MHSVTPETHVLFIEPEIINRNALHALFNSDYTVHLAGTAAEAFSILQKFPIAVITTEANLGEVDGADFLAAVKNVYPSITTILLTDIQDSVLAIRLINEGSVFRYLVKPFRRDTLRTTMSEAILEHKSAQEKPGASVKMLESEQVPALCLQDDNMSNILKNVREIVQHRIGY